MPWVIERQGTFHSPGGWRASVDAATRYDSPEDAEDDRRVLLGTTLAGLAGEVHIKEVTK
ncbi:MAG: hypothetical protein ABSC06_25055 [Rhodopila sp.]|jgi:hypothetical protein